MLMRILEDLEIKEYSLEFLTELKSPFQFKNTIITFLRDEIT